MPIEDLVPDQWRVASERTGLLIEPDSHSTRFIMEDAATRKIMQQAELVAPHLRLAVIEGEHGVGKQTFARHLYLRATAANPQLRRVGFSRCDAREWLLSEADPQSMAGFFYLDRVDLLAAPGQTLLLRTLKKLDAWPASCLMLVASSEVPIRALAANAQFLPELAFRLSAVRFAIPPMRERKGDIVPLATFLLDCICRRYHLQPFSVSAEAIEQMLAYAWPGNVREMASVLESAVVGCAGTVICSEDLALRTASAIADTTAPTTVLNLDAAIQNHVRYVLELNRGNKLRAARQLGISRSTLYRMLGNTHSFTS
jgi:two-component system response regulator AtoC